MLFEEYSTKYETIHMERTDDGVLTLRFHTGDGPLQWGKVANEEFPEAFAQVAADRGNEVVIITGTGSLFTGPSTDTTSLEQFTPEEWDIRMTNGMAFIASILDIKAPVISCLNGPVYRHPEIPLLGDIVIASPSVAFRDFHYSSGMVPGDSVGVIFPFLMGLSRARYFLLTGQVLDADELLRLGLVNEVLPEERLMERARELAAMFLAQDPMVRRYTRVLLTRQLRHLLNDQLGFGLALEGLAVSAATPRRPGE